MIHDKDRKMHKKNDINKYLEIDRYVDKYTDIINGKIELLNNIGVMFDSAMIEIQSKVDMINDVKQKENIDIETLELIHKILDEILKKWMGIISKAFENDIFSKYDMKPDKPDTKKGVNLINQIDLINLILRNEILEVNQILRNEILGVNQINQIDSIIQINQINLINQINQILNQILKKILNQIMYVILKNIGRF